MLTQTILSLLILTVKVSGEYGTGSDDRFDAVRSTFDSDSDQPTIPDEFLIQHASLDTNTLPDDMTHPIPMRFKVNDFSSDRDTMSESDDVTSRIVGGKVSVPAQFPYQASLRYYYIGHGFQHICGGALIGRDTVLTAAHCVENTEPFRLLVILGEYLLDGLEGNEQIFKVKRIRVHPKFSRSELSNDIAVLKLDHKARYTKAVKPIQLATGKKDYTGKDCVISGWGFTTGEGPGSNVLQYAVVPAISNSECKEYFPTLARGTICVLSEDRQRGGCYGDSGGPAVCGERLVGITSYGKPGCLTEYPTVYTRVSYFYRFIRRDDDD